MSIAINKTYHIDDSFSDTKIEVTGINFNNDSNDSVELVFHSKNNTAPKITLTVDETQALYNCFETILQEFS